MPAEPLIKPLDYKKRTWFFRSLFLVFAVLLPMVIFYATGYRFDFTKTSPNIISTGGLYMSVPAESGEIYINDEIVRDIRVFRRASYIQNLSAGVHRVHVQGEGLQTWVKELPVRAHIVTEAESFNMPEVPQVRLISNWLAGGVSVYPGVSTTTIASDFSFASGTERVVASSTLATTTLDQNQEYEFVISLFGTSTSEGTLVERVVQGVNDAFTFPNASSSATTTATTTVILNNMKLSEVDGEVYAMWLGGETEIPYYFCVNYTAASSTAANYGEHVYEGVASVLATMPVTESQNITGRICRETIRIDRLGQDYEMFTFFPGSTDLVLMHLTEGLYVVEIDDRAWQNTQLLYPGTDLEVTVDGENIYIKDRGYILEVLTEIVAE